MLLNAANEEAVAAFADRRIGFTDIASIVEAVLNAVEISAVDDIGSVAEADRIARQSACGFVARGTWSAARAARVASLGAAD